MQSYKKLQKVTSVLQKNVTFFNFVCFFIKCYYKNQISIIMGKIKYAMPVESMSGKFAQNADIASEKTGMHFFLGIRKNWKVGTFTNTFAVRRRKYEGVLTAAQKEINAKFSALEAWARALKVDDPDTYNNYKTAFGRQRKYKTLSGFIFGKAYNYFERDSQTQEWEYNAPYENYPLPEE